MTTLQFTRKNFLTTSQAIANDPEKIQMNVDNFLKAALRPEGKMRLEATKDKEAKKEKERKTKQ